MTNIEMSTIAAAPKTLRVLGVDVAVHLDGEATNGQYTAYRMTVPPQVGPPPHRHDAFDEAFVVLSGTVELFAGGRSQVVGPGESAFVPRGVVHTFRNVGEGSAVLMGVATPSGHEAFFLNADSLEGPLTPEAATALCARHGIELVL